jgi:hypothetical protein
LKKVRMISRQIQRFTNDVPLDVKQAHFSKKIYADKLALNVMKIISLKWSAAEITKSFNDMQVEENFPADILISSNGHISYSF